LLERSGTRDEKKKYRKAAEIILLKSLNANPSNEEAKVLLQHARTVSDTTDLSQTVEAKEWREPKEEWWEQRELKDQQRETKAPDEIPFTAAPSVFERKEERKPRTKLPATLIAVIALTGGIVWAVQAKRNHPKAQAEPAAQTQSTKTGD